MPRRGAYYRLSEGRLQKAGALMNEVYALIDARRHREMRAI
jgi:hypothetical protein